MTATTDLSCLLRYQQYLTYLTRPPNTDYSEKLFAEVVLRIKMKNRSVILRAQNGISNNKNVPHFLMKYCKNVF